MIKFANTFCNIVKKVCHYLCYVSMFIIVFMMCIMFCDAVGGLFFGQRILGSYEIVQMVLSIVVFTSWAYTQTVHGHIHVVMFIRKFPQRARFIIFGLVSLLSTVVMAFGSYGVWKMIMDKIADNGKTATLLIPFWPFYVIEFISFIIFTIALLADTIKAFVANFDKKSADEIMESWA